MTAYAPRHAHTMPREPRRPSLYQRARRLLLSLLPARKLVLPAPEPGIVHFDGVLSAEDLSAFRARWSTLTDAEIAALRPVYAVRHDGLVTVSGTGEVEVYPSPLAWQGSSTATAAQPVLDEEAAELARAERIREQLPECGRPDAETLERVRDALRNLPEQGNYCVKPVADVLDGERLAKGLIA